MTISNIHKRTINQPLEIITALFTTLSTTNDKIWPKEKWPRIFLNNGLKEGSFGGHGFVRYTITKYKPNHIIIFEFSKPNGFIGYHSFEFNQIGLNKTEIKNTLKIDISCRAILFWKLVIRPLHDALIEDGFDKIENQFSSIKIKTKWSPWVIFLRKLFTLVK